MLRSSLIVVALLAAILAAAISPVDFERASTAALAGVRGDPESDAFILRTETDTLAVERFSTLDGRLEGELVDLQAGGLRKSYAVLLGKGGVISTFVLAVRPESAARESWPIRRVAVTFRKGSAVHEERVEGNPQRRRLTTRGRGLPYLPFSIVLLEQATRQASSFRRDRLEISLVHTEDNRTLRAVVVRTAEGAMTLRIDGLQIQVKVDEKGRILGGSIPDQGITIERVRSAVIRLFQGNDYSPPADAPYVAEEVIVRASARHWLAGTLTLPGNRVGPHPAMILVTGSGPQERDASYLGTYRPFRQIADTLSRSGIAVLRLDDRGVGASTGRFVTATSADFADDVRAALAYLRTRPDVDNERLGLLGESEGGLVASMVAATDPDLRALVLLGTPSRTGRSLIASQVRYRLEADGLLPPAERDSLVDAVEARNDSLAGLLPWLRFILDYDPIPTAVRVTTPVLILQGETDRQVFASQAEELAVAFRGGGNHDVTVRVFSKLNHLFLEDENGDPERYASLASKALPAHVLGTITEWVTEHLIS
jgi:pimeloyl-ACP methyl ester carboxylesterase